MVPLAMPRESAWDVIKTLAALPSFLHLAFAGALHAFYGYGAAAFIPSFFIRVHQFETGELGTLDRVRRASVLAMHAGADFIKTSTGKIQPAATMQVTLVMLQAIRDYFYDTGRMVGMKPAGGISSAKLAIHYLVMLRETLGNAWMTPEWFRFGASSLANDVLMQIVKQETGVYQSADYFSKD